MRKIRTFKDIVQQFFFDEIENRVSLYVERNFRDEEFQSSRVDRVDEAHVQFQAIRPKISLRANYSSLMWFFTAA